MILVSVIIPCYNSERYIVQSIESVIMQTFQQWEMIIVDDCSTDNSADIIKKYEAKDFRIRYLKTNEPSGSPSIPRNIGIREARGRYIAFLDSDVFFCGCKGKRFPSFLQIFKEVFFFLFFG